MDRTSVASPQARTAILVVDDNEVARETLREVMASLGFSVDVATGAREALAACDERHYDAVICDLKMPHMEGDELYRVCEQRHPEIARGFIFLSGSFAPPKLSHLGAITGQPYLSKPWRLADLQAAVAEVAMGSVA